MVQLNCSNVPDSIAADSDIVGTGVLVAFFVSALATLAAVVFAYLTGSLDDKYLNELDQNIIASIARQWRHRIRHVYTDLSKDPAEESRSVKARAEAITVFILTLSDQQFVTGLAILVAGISSPSNITLYEFSVVVSLAWFSSTTHLATLTALRPYLQRHNSIRNARVVGMVLVLGLLSYALVVNIAGGMLFTMPVACTFNRADDSTLRLTFRLLGIDFIFLQLFFAYWTRFQELYLGEGHPALVPILAYWSIAKPDTGGLSLREYFAELYAEQRLSRLVKTVAESSDATTSLFKRLIASAVYLHGSFLSTLPDLAFSFAFGITQVGVSRWYQPPLLDPESYRMGFGQVMALLLLLLPVLVAAEAYKDYRIQSQDKAEAKKRSHQVGFHSSAKNDEDHADLLKASQRFDANLPQLKKLFAREIRCKKVVKDDATDNVSTETLLHREALLAKYDAITSAITRHQQQRKLHRLVQVLFWFSLLTFLFAGATLMVAGPVSLVGLVALSLRWAFSLSMTWTETVYILRSKPAFGAVQMLCSQSTALICFPSGTAQSKPARRLSQADSVAT